MSQNGIRRVTFLFRAGTRAVYGQDRCAPGAAPKVSLSNISQSRSTQEARLSSMEARLSEDRAKI